MTSTRPTRQLPIALALSLAALALAGCSGEESTSSRIVIDFPAGHNDVDARVADADLHAFSGSAEEPTVRHQLLAWAHRSGADVKLHDFGADAGGNCLDSIDSLPTKPGCSLGAEGYWSLSVDGEVAQEGMDSIEVHHGTVVTWTYTPLEASGPASTAGTAPALVVDAPQPTQGDHLTLTGSLDRAARLSVTGVQPLEAAAGKWSVQVPLEFGQTNLTVVADDGAGTATKTLTAVRLASAQVKATFASALPPRPDVEATVWFDVDAFLSAPLYEGKGIPHPPHPNVHDAMVAWTQQANHPVEYSYSASFAFGVESIDGFGALSDWCYSVNGETADLGITGQEFHPGDVIAWAGCFIL